MMDCVARSRIYGPQRHAMTHDCVLVTGAQGFVGRYLVAELLSTDDNRRIVGTGRSVGRTDAFTHTLTQGGIAKPAPLPPAMRQILQAAEQSGRYRYVAGDLTRTEDVHRVLDAAEASVLVHNAAALRHAERGTIQQTNVAGTECLLEAAATSSVTRVVFVSSGGVYGAPQLLPISETAEPVPIDPYGISKLQAERAARAMAVAQGWEFACIRLFNVIGPGQDEHHICGTVARQLLAPCSDAVLRLGSLHTSRDFVDVRDVARAIALFTRTPLYHDIYNVGSGREVCMRDMVEMMISMTDPRFRLVEGVARPLDIPRHFGEVARIGALGVAVSYSLRESLSDLISYVRANS